ncbi:hypothetical protein E6O75_ATG05755 [Venturia nashicola]|uniref:PCI domain-containing protein n=1 Tax=Venturia nashicola TaxID=86259 RepID=A0A4Z1PE78_9PEZI|nr:hypothetical protein E6O75_ATG05755 [Venturia nashicola]
MASDLENSLFFTEQAASGKRIVRDLPKLDLESYANNYDGPTKIMRLQVIATTCPPLALEAFRMAITELMKGKDVQSYMEVAAEFQKLVPNEPLAQINTNWVSQQAQRNSTETNRLEHELKTYKNNLIKESIRMGQEDIGRHFFEIADYTNAFKALSRMREYCTTSKQIAQMTLKLLRVCIFSQNWTVVHSYQQKVLTLQMTDEEKAKYDPILAACAGLAHLKQDHYLEAATSFLSVHHSFITPEPQAGINFQREVISPNDVAVYGGLCALAVMDRDTLQRRVLENTAFRPILETEPHIRRALTMFCSSKYSGCLNILESYMADYLIDLHLQDHFVKLYRLVRAKCIVQWCSAFSKVTFAEIEKAFPSKLVDGGKIQGELERMVMNGQLDARIDLVDKLLVSPNPDQRISVIQDTLKMAKDHEKALRLRLHKINLQAAGLIVKGQNGNNNSNMYESSGGDAGGNSDFPFNLRGNGGRPKRGNMLGGFHTMV